MEVHTGMNCIIVYSIEKVYTSVKKKHKMLKDVGMVEKIKETRHEESNQETLKVI